ncbi:MAG: hypothetical protein HYZ18_05450 [Pseudogulbenkiania sp.]|nr:hypothetical protein [Pseudogulbenkiania sp.]
MQAVVQEDLSGCGIASVAVLAGQSYQQVWRVAGELGIDVHDPRLWSDTTHVRTLLGHYGIRAMAGETPFTGWDALPDLALLAIKWHLDNGRPFWHWVVYRRSPQGAVVFDPKRVLRSNTRTDFGRIKPKWFIAISPC